MLSKNCPVEHSEMVATFSNGRKVSNSEGNDCSLEGAGRSAILYLISVNYCFGVLKGSRIIKHELERDLREYSVPFSHFTAKETD